MLQLSYILIQTWTQLFLELTEVAVFLGLVTDEKRPAVYLELFPDEGERINLHHSLKEVGDAASKAVKDIHGYVRQQLTSMAKKTTNIISTPLIKLLGPVQYLRDKLDDLTGHDHPSSTPGDISVWCPDCAEMNKTGNIRPARPTPQSDVGSDYYLTIGHQHSQSTESQESSFSSSTKSSFVALPEDDGLVTTEPIDLTGLEIISPADWEKLKHSHPESPGSSEGSSSEEEGGIDIRFGKDETKGQS